MSELIDEKHAPSRPPDSDALLNLLPGVLNEGFDEDPTQPGGNRDTETGWSLLQRVVSLALNPNTLASHRKYKAILLRKDNPYDDGNPHTAQDVALMSAAPMKDSTKYKLPTYKVCIPELHFALPKPNNLQNPSAQDQLIIDTYPTAQAADRNSADLPVVPGDIVWIELSDAFSLSTGLVYLGPLDHEGLGTVKATGQSPISKGDCLEKCIQTYPNRGSIGDTISKDRNLVKPGTGISPVISGEGISGAEYDKVITGPEYKEWVVDMFKRLKGEGKYKGLIWVGICENNGPADNIGMLDNDGRPTTTGKPGRSTVIYMPTGTDPTQPLEIIYWFHDSLGFKNNLQEWRDLWSSSLNSMIQKKEKRLGGGRRNFIFVIPEMPWSLQASNPQSGVPRQNKKPLVGSTASVIGAGYRESQWAAWGFNGALAEGFLPNQNKEGYYHAQHLFPYSWPRGLKQNLIAPYGWINVRPGHDGNMVLLHEEVLNILKNHFGAIAREYITLTLVAHGRGGAAISNLARLHYYDFRTDPEPGLALPPDPPATPLSRLSPSKIVFIDSDYSSVEKNYYHDNDLYQIVKHCNQASPPRIEVHLTPSSAQAASLPQKAASAFFGALGHVLSSALTITNFKLGVDALSELYTNWPHARRKFIYRAPEKNQVDGAVYGYYPRGEDCWPFTDCKEDLKLTYESGVGLLNKRKNSFFKMPGVFDNIVYKGWPGADPVSILGAIAWLEASESTAAATPVINQITKSERDIKAAIIAESNIPSEVKKTFENFNGKVVLYPSELVGPSKTVAILQPYPAAAWEEYELIYYFHGDIGQNGAAKTFNTALINQINTMIEAESATSWQGRNVIIVLMDIDPHPLSYASKLWNDPEKPDITFNKFHEEVLGKIKNTLSWCSFGAQCMGFPYMPAKDPKFFTIKAHGGGSRMLKHAISNLDAKYIGAPGGLQRIDFLDGNWGVEYQIINTIYTGTTWASKVVPGENFEIQIIASAQTFGPKKIPASVRAAKYLPDGESARSGIWVELTSMPYGALPYNYFSAPSKLASDPEISSKAIFLAQIAGHIPFLKDMTGFGDGKVVPPSLEDSTLLTFGKDGKAYAPPGPPYYGMHVPKFDLSDAITFFKGKLENHIPSTEQISQIRKCDVECLQTKSVTTPQLVSPALVNQDCKTNPLGLTEYKTSQFTSIKIDPSVQGFSWGTTKVGDYLRGLDNGLWERTSYTDSSNTRVKRPTKWIVKDISPRAANGVDRVKHHKTHREGIDIDIVLPQLNIITTSEPTPKAADDHKLKTITSRELDVDKTIAFLILSRLHGAEVIFLDKKFFGRIRARAEFIATDGAKYSSLSLALVTDAALKPFFRKHLFGKPRVVEELMQLLEHKPGHEDRLQVRVERRLALHEEYNHPRPAIKRLKSLGCDYEGLVA